jgi:UDP-N-acetylmuramoyl-L-alanyl-D-glutamate--2,6-diaminopimelate ligase
MFLSDLIASLPYKNVDGATALTIKGIACHSTRVKDGYLFFALRGTQSDGHDFIYDAYTRGAKAVVVEKYVEKIPRLTQIIVPDARDAMGRLSSVFYGNPSEKMRLVGITGTNGKTTTTFILESILREAGREVGVIGTINYRFSGVIRDGDTTTPESVNLQRLLRDMIDAGIEDCVMEVSSHALSLKRIAGAVFKGGIFTNLSQDHLDFHGDMDSYFMSKAAFFKETIVKNGSQDAFSVVNVDDPRGNQIIPEEGTVLTYGKREGADIKPSEIHFSRHGIEGVIQVPGGKVRVSSHLIGEFNLYNIMAAVGAGIGLGVPHEVIERGIESLKSVKGRMERICAEEGFDVVVDYAHTEDALKNFLLSLRSLMNETGGMGRLITVFGCGGDRDRGKRPTMGRVSAEESDITILTSDNPRSEDPYRIIEEIETGLKDYGLKNMNTSSHDGKGYMIEPLRSDAINRAVALARVGDTILIAGKGHENYQIVGNDVLPFDDCCEVKRALKEMKKLKIKM